MKSKPQRIYRVDRFIVPRHARDEFVNRVRGTHELLKIQPGYLQDFVLEMPMGPDKVSVVTFVEWDNAEAIEQAKSVVMAMQKEQNFNPKEMFSRLGVKAEFGDYKRVE